MHVVVVQSNKCESIPLMMTTTNDYKLLNIGKNDNDDNDALIQGHRNDDNDDNDDNDTSPIIENDSNCNNGNSKFSYVTVNANDDNDNDNDFKLNCIIDFFLA